MRIKVESGARSHADSRYLSRTGARSYRALVQSSCFGREVSRAYLCTAYVYLSLSAKVLTSEAVAEAKYMLQS